MEEKTEQTMDQQKETEKIPCSLLKEFDIEEQAYLLRAKLYVLKDSVEDELNCFDDGPYRDALTQMLEEATETLFKIEEVAKTGRVKGNYYEDFKWVPENTEGS